MKKKAVYLLLLLAGMVFASSCGVVTSSGGGRGIFGEFSSPRFWIVKNGSVDLNNPLQPATGEVVASSAVTITNTTTGVTAVATWDSSNQYFRLPSWTFSLVPGQSVSISISTEGETITGSPTMMPNPTFSGLTPATGVATLPATISWSVVQGTAEAAYTRVLLIPMTSTTAKAYMTAVPASQKSLTITSSNVTAGNNYMVIVFGVNSMTLGSGAASGSAVYVSGGNSVSGFLTF